MHPYLVVLERFIPHTQPKVLAVRGHILLPPRRGQPRGCVPGKHLHDLDSFPM